MELLELAFAELSRSNVDKRHPFRNMVLATHSEYPEQRTVVKRKFDPKEGITFYTDSRTPKCDQLVKNPKVSLLFYHTKKKLQLRVYGEAFIISEDDPRYISAKEQIVNSASKNDYLTRQTPGSILDQQEVHYGEQLHLAVIQVEIHAIDVVLLHREGHKRSRFLHKTDSWIENQLVP